MVPITLGLAQGDMASGGGERYKKVKQTIYSQRRIVQRRKGSKVREWRCGSSGKTSGKVTCQGARHRDIWEKTARDRRNNRCKGTEVRTNLVCLCDRKKASVESGKR